MYLRIRDLAVDVVGRFCYRSVPALFSVSTGRCGTTTLIHLLSASDRILAWHEPEPRLREEMMNSYREVWEKPERYRRLFVSARRRLLGYSYLKGKIYAESTLLKFFAPVIATELPRAKFIHLYRHPAGVIRSGMRRDWYQSHKLDVYRLEPLPDDPARTLWDNEWDTFAKICWYWHAVNDFMLRFCTHVGPGRVFPVKMEELVVASSGAYERLFDFAELPAPAAEVARSILSTKYNEQTEAQYPKYFDWSSQQRETLYRIAGATMERLGYE